MSSMEMRNSCVGIPAREECARYVLCPKVRDGGHKNDKIVGEDQYIRRVVTHHM